MNGPLRIPCGFPGIGAFLALSPLLWGQTGDTTDLYRSIRDRRVSVDLGPAAEAGYVKVKYSAIGGSSGDTVRVEVERLAAAGPRDPLYFSLPPGLHLGNSTSSEQAMVVLGVKGREVGGGRFEPTDQIVVGDAPASYLVEAYCAEFHKGNPSSSSFFSPENTDPMLACVLDQARVRNLSVSGKQAAVWQYTDRIGFDEMASRIWVTMNDWAAAKSVVEYCRMRPPHMPAQNGRQRLLGAAAEVMSQGVDTVFSQPGLGPQQAFMFLLSTVSAFTRVTDPTPDELTLGVNAAKALQETIPNFFTAANKPAGTTDARWAEGRTAMEKMAMRALTYPAILAAKPGADAMDRYAVSKDVKECVAAESSYKKALEQYPEDAAIAYQLGRALRCQQAASSRKVEEALYEFARAATLDPTLGGPMDPKALQTYLENAYILYHGSLEGIDRLMQQAKGSPLPPAGFAIETAAAMAAKFNPQLALWLAIKRGLEDADGVRYFENKLKDSAVPPMKGTLVEAKPACKSKELLVAIPLPDQQGNPVAEITLKLDAPLTGKPEAGATIQWTGVPKAFTKDPFMLTIEVEEAKWENLKTTPCGAAPAKKAASKKK